MAKPVVFVIGASGQIGSATVQALSTRFSDKLDIRAGVRNPDKADKLKGVKGVTVVRAEMGVKGELVNTFKGVNALYIVTPPQNRVELVTTTSEAAKEAGVKHILVIGGSSADHPDTVFGKQWAEIEVGISTLGVSFTIIRLPWFLENFLSQHKSTIQESSQFYLPVDPTKHLTSVAVEDAGVASAVILADPKKHASKTYTIVSDCHTFGDVAAAFTEALGREVKYVRVPYEDLEKRLLGKGVLQWLVDGLISYLKRIDSGLDGADSGDFERITGEKPTSLKEWVAKVKDTFK